MPQRRFRHPNESAKNRLVYRTFEAALRDAGSRYARGRMIDIGGGRKPWQPIFAPYVTEHLCVDHVEKDDARGATVDVIATAYDVPLPDGDAQTLLLTEVLEHLERPADALAECFRLLAPGGHIIATTPLFWHIHDTRDFFRYTPQGLRYLFTEAGFEVVELRPLGGLWSTVSIEVSYGLEKYRRPWSAAVVDATCTSMQWLATRWERVDRQPKFSWNHLIVARKAT
ncbi:MAG TPA: methyltransferase domain-containing protein [Gaiellales bacterium]